ncbi:MAG: hypothetical protein K8I82_17080, partial [Anaerolineae bacterium]|nr:hypothetical protein [Anaerolineae bacterium]
RYGRSKIKTLRKHPESLRLRQAMAPLFVAGLVIGLPVIVLFPLLGWLYFGVIIVYGMLGLIFAARVATSSRESITIWRVMLTFVIMHMAWGIGFWRELIKPDPL